MSTQRHITRRQMLGAAVAGAAGVIAGTLLQGSEHQTGLYAHAAAADPKIQGPFPILSTPFTASGAVDFDVLANQARFVGWGGCPGMIWPQSGDSVDLLTTDEKLRGMEVLAQASRGLRTALCLGVQGKDTAEMLDFARHAEKLAPAAIISRPPDSGRTEDDLRQYWRALAAVAQWPVIIQTTGGVAYKGPVPYLWKKRGVFRTMVSRHYGPGNTIPSSPICSELTLTAEDMAEIEYRFEALKPYLRPGSPSFAASPEGGC